MPHRQPPIHVWVTLNGMWSGRSPGVLLAWRRRRDSRDWEAWVIRASAYSTGGGSEIMVHQSWVPAHLIHPVDE